MSYYLYKGLKKPLIIFGLKDKYIYQAGGTIVSGFIIGAILSKIVGILGLLLGFGLMGLAVYLIFKRQDKKGLYNKTINNNEIHIYSPKIKHKKISKLR